MADKEKPELTVLTTFKTLQIEGPEYQLDLDEDAWSYGAPPPKGVYEFKWYPVKEDAFQTGYMRKGDANTFFTQVNVEGHLVNDSDWEGVVAYAYLSSRIGRGKQISPMAGFLIAGGQKELLKKQKHNPKNLAYICEVLLKKEPVIRAEIDWRGSYSYANPKNPQEQIWENVANKYEDFPVDQEDKTKRVHIYTTTGKDGLPKEIRAQLRVTRFLAKGEEYKPAKVAMVGASGVIAPILIQEQEQLVSDSVVPTPTLVSQPRAQKVTANPPVVVGEEEDVALMLAE